MPSVIFYQKPCCKTNLKQKAWLEEKGYTLEVRNLLVWPWTADELLLYFRDLPVTAWFNPAAPRIKSGDLNPDELSEEQALAMLLHEPLLIRRPLLQFGSRCMVGFDPVGLQTLLDLGQKTNSESVPKESCSRSGSGSPACQIAISD